MYRLIVRVTAMPGKRDTLIAILIAGTTQMPGCLSYIVAKDSLDANVWITEVWESEASHSASLSLTGVKDAIPRGKPLIAEFGRPVLTQPVGGYGLATH
jgi:quinol monooxygenase YgiN